MVNYRHDRPPSALSLHPTQAKRGLEWATQVGYAAGTWAGGIPMIRRESSEVKERPGRCFKARVSLDPILDKYHACNPRLIVKRNFAWLWRHVIVALWGPGGIRTHTPARIRNRMQVLVKDRHKPEG
jgi:hypothetical protein